MAKKYFKKNWSELNKDQRRSLKKEFGSKQEWKAAKAKAVQRNNAPAKNPEKAAARIAQKTDGAKYNQLSEVQKAKVDRRTYKQAKKDQAVTPFTPSPTPVPTPTRTRSTPTPAPSPTPTPTPTPSTSSPAPTPAPTNSASTPTSSNTATSNSTAAVPATTNESMPNQEWQEAKTKAVEFKEESKSPGYTYEGSKFDAQSFMQNLTANNQTWQNKDRRTGSTSYNLNLM